MGRDLYRQPEIVVPLVRLGIGGEPWTIATDGLSSGMVVYSFGVGEDIGFERDVIEHFGLTVHAFDPTPISLRWIARQALPAGFFMHPYGVADHDGIARFAAPMKGYISFSLVRSSGHGGAIEAPVRRLSTLQRKLDLLAPDILKMDIEGAEYAVLADAISSGYRPAQILVEFHHRYRETGARRTRQAIELLRGVGYRIAYVSPNGMVYTFVRL
jgi:FkbM family methyltransferase